MRAVHPPRPKFLVALRLVVALALPIAISIADYAGDREASQENAWIEILSPLDGAVAKLPLEVAWQLHCSPEFAVDLSESGAATAAPASASASAGVSEAAAAVSYTVDVEFQGLSATGRIKVSCGEQQALVLPEAEFDRSPVSHSVEVILREQGMEGEQEEDEVVVGSAWSTFWAEGERGIDAAAELAERRKEAEARELASPERSWMSGLRILSVCDSCAQSHPGPTNAHHRWDAAERGGGGGGRGPESHDIIGVESERSVGDWAQRVEEANRFLISKRLGGVFHHSCRPGGRSSTEWTSPTGGSTSWLLSQLVSGGAATGKREGCGKHPGTIIVGCGLVLLKPMLDELFNMWGQGSDSQRGGACKAMHGGGSGGSGVLSPWVAFGSADEPAVSAAAQRWIDISQEAKKESGERGGGEGGGEGGGCQDVAACIAEIAKAITNSHGDDDCYPAGGMNWSPGFSPRGIYEHALARRGDDALSNKEDGFRADGGREGADHVAIVVPIRNREESLIRLARGISSILGPKTRYYIWAVEQAEGGAAGGMDEERPFNRGALLNVGFLAAEASGARLIALHDVDYVPLEEASDLYVRPFLDEYDGPRHAIGRADSAGGVVIVSPNQYRLANGYPNCFWGWGFEDHDLLERFRNVGLEMDRSHWPDPGSFTYFEGYEALQDCGGSHGNRTGCASSEASHEREEAQEQNRIRFLAARLKGRTEEAQRGDASDRGDAGRGDGEQASGSDAHNRFGIPRSRACGVSTVDFRVLAGGVGAAEEGCGEFCARLRVQLGPHDACQAV